MTTATGWVTTYLQLINIIIIIIIIKHLCVWGTLFELERIRYVGPADPFEQ
jgi:hypothetical protein